MAIRWNDIVLGDDRRVCSSSGVKPKSNVLAKKRGGRGGRVAMVSEGGLTLPHPEAPRFLTLILSANHRHFPLSSSSSSFRCRFTRDHAPPPLPILSNFSNLPVTAKPRTSLLSWFSSKETVNFLSLAPSSFLPRTSTTLKFVRRAINSTDWHEFPTGKYRSFSSSFGSVRETEQFRAKPLCICVCVCVSLVSCERPEQTERTDQAKLENLPYRSAPFARLVGIMGIDRTGRKRPSRRSGNSVRPHPRPSIRLFSATSPPHLPSSSPFSPSLVPWDTRDSLISAVRNAVLDDFASHLPMFLSYPLSISLSLAQIYAVNPERTWRANFFTLASFLSLFHFALNRAEAILRLSLSTRKFA